MPFQYLYPVSFRILDCFIFLTHTTHNLRYVTTGAKLTMSEHSGSATKYDIRTTDERIKYQAWIRKTAKKEQMKALRYEEVEEVANNVGANISDVLNMLQNELNNQGVTCSVPVCKTQWDQMVSGDYSIAVCPFCRSASLVIAGKTVVCRCGFCLNMSNDISSLYSVTKSIASCQYSHSAVGCVNPGGGIFSFSDVTTTRPVSSVRLRETLASVLSQFNDSDVDVDQLCGLSQQHQNDTIPQFSQSSACRDDVFLMFNCTDCGFMRVVL